MSKKSQQYNEQMQATSVGTTSTQRKRAIEPVSIDDLALFQDTELDARVVMLEEELHKRGFSVFSVQAAPFEAELAYVQREQYIRQQRRVLHRKFLQSLETEYVDERNLPVYEGNPPNWD